MEKQSDKNYKIAILANENADDHAGWVDACKKHSGSLEYSIIDLTQDNWLHLIALEDYDIFLLRPPGSTELFKKIYDERALIIATILQKLIYPSLNEVLIYENKRYLRDWMVAMHIPHPETYIFLNRKDAIKFVQTRQKWPLVAKTNIGASGNGVSFLTKKDKALKYIKSAFSKGINTRTGPKLFKGSLLSKIWKGLTNPVFFKKRLGEYSKVILNPQKGFIIFQEFILHDFEWRCVRIGESFFAHKKLAKNNKASGKLIKAYDTVPFALLDFIYEITEQSKLFSVAIDLFENKGGFLVNEIQCYFGQSDPFQMLVNGKPGRYRKSNNSWIFEEGMFNTNMSFDIRLEHVLSILAGRK